MMFARNNFILFFFFSILKYQVSFANVIFVTYVTWLKLAAFFVYLLLAASFLAILRAFLWLTTYSGMRMCCRTGRKSLY